jgi:TerC family integral membrane protein
MLDVTTTAWLLTVGLVVLLLAVDLGFAALRPHEVGFVEAAVWTVFYTVVAVLFGVAFGLIAGWDFGGEYFAGYVVERSLSIDNLFVFVVILGTFAVPREHQQKVLVIGIVLALVLRVIFILVGAALLDAFSFMFLVFGLVLFATAIQLFRHRDEDPAIEDNGLVNFAQKRLPVTDSYDGGKLLTTVGSRRMVTPLFIVLLAIGSTDVLFALDSIPAVFGVTDEVFIVFAANAFALLGMRPLYFLVTGLLDRLVYLSLGLSVILAFIGLKLALHWGHLQNDSVPEISTVASLVVIAVVLAIVTVASIVKTRRDPSIKAHAGSLRGHSEKAAREPHS